MIRLSRLHGIFPGATSLAEGAASESGYLEARAAVRAAASMDTAGASVNATRSSTIPLLCLRKEMTSLDPLQSYRNVAALLKEDAGGECTQPVNAHAIASRSLGIEHDAHVTIHGIRQANSQSSRLRAVQRASDGNAPALGTVAAHVEKELLTVTKRVPAVEEEEAVGMGRILPRGCRSSAAKTKSAP